MKRIFLRIAVDYGIVGGVYAAVFGLVYALREWGWTAAWAVLSVIGITGVMHALGSVILYWRTGRP